MRTTTIPRPPYLEVLAPAFVAELWDLCDRLDLED
jgi:hypothetical protein